MDAMAQDQDRPARNLLGAPVQRRTVIAAAAASGLLVACGTGSDPGSGADPSPADPSDGAAGSGGYFVRLTVGGRELEHRLRLLR